MSVEVQSALLIAAPGQTKRGSHLLLDTKSVDLISRGIILQYQREGCWIKMTQGQEAEVMCLPLPASPTYLAVKCEYCETDKWNVTSQSEDSIAPVLTNERAPLLVTCDQWVLSDGLLGSHQ